jgi:hypothetical protein
LKPEKLIFLDETWAKTNMTRLYGRAPRGKRLIGTAPFGHWNTTTFIAGLRHDRIVAPMVLEGPINSRAFRAWPLRTPPGITVEGKFAAMLMMGQPGLSAAAPPPFLPNPAPTPIYHAYARQPPHLPRPPRHHAARPPRGRRHAPLVGRQFRQSS